MQGFFIAICTLAALTLLQSGLVLIVAANPLPTPSRPWRDIARELANETSGKRITELADELTRAVDEQAHSFPKA
jgi:hypothetical protein